MNLDYRLIFGFKKKINYAIVISFLSLIIAGIGAYFSISVHIKTLKAEEKYNEKVEAMLESSIDVSMLLNEQLREAMRTHNQPVKTLEQYERFLANSIANFNKLDTVDLSKLNEVNLVNFQGYYLDYSNYIFNIEMGIERMKLRSEVIKKEIEKSSYNFEGFTLDDEKEVKETLDELVDSKYKVDYIVLESNSVIIGNNIQYLIEKDQMLKQLRDGVKNNKKAEGTNIRKLYEELHEENEKNTLYLEDLE